MTGRVEEAVRQRLSRSCSASYDPSMLTLGIETSGRDGGLALVNDGRVLGAVELSRTGRRHARTLVSELAALVTRCGLRPRDIECIAVSIGPGSFTGLRVGVVCAKTLAYAVRCPVVAIDTLAAIAANSPAEVKAVDVVVDAQRGDLFVGRYERTDSGEWHCPAGLRIESCERWLAEREPDLPVTGPAAASLVLHSSDLLVLSAECFEPRADLIARLGERAALSGRTDDLWGLEPRYIRKAAAEELAERAGTL